MKSATILTAQGTTQQAEMTKNTIRSGTWRGMPPAFGGQYAIRYTTGALFAVVPDSALGVK